MLNEFYGISINNARFDKGIIQLKKLNLPPTYLLEFLDKCTATVNRILDLRNFQDHTPKKTVVKNFHITAKGLFSPTWQVVPETEKPMLPEMHELLGSLIELLEKSLFSTVLYAISAGPFASFAILWKKSLLRNGKMGQPSDFDAN